MNTVTNAFFVSIISLLYISNLNASENRQLTTTQKYPFNDTDIALFYTASTQKIESPYSTASVNLFPEDKFVTIKNSEYKKIHTHALKRSGQLATAAMGLYGHYAENSKPRKHYGSIVSSAAECNKILRTMQTQEIDAQSVQLSERNLMHLLQWSNGITTRWLTMTGLSDKEFFIEISLGQENIVASKALKLFVAGDGRSNHIQNHKNKWMCDL